MYINKIFHPWETINKIDKISISQTEELQDMEESNTKPAAKERLSSPTPMEEYGDLSVTLSNFEREQNKLPRTTSQQNKIVL